MPELPEVETIRLGLHKHVAGRTVTDVVAKENRLFRHNEGGLEGLREAVFNSTFEAAHRRGKFMWLTLNGDSNPGETEALVVHLGMSGQVWAQTKESAAPGSSVHEHLWLSLDDGSALSFVDQRTFGHLTACDLVVQGGRAVPSAMSHIAPDPLESAFDPDWVVGRGRGSRRKVKTLIMDQTLVSGIGNIYADEALYRARISGLHPGKDLSKKKWTELLTHSRQVMEEAIEVGGTSFDELYVDVNGTPGYFARSLAVYGRKGRPCLTCGEPIERTQVDGRGHFFCPNCNCT